LSQGFSSSNLRTGQITVCSNLKIQISEDDDEDEEFMQLPYLTLPCLLLGTYSSIMTQVVVITSVGWSLELKKLAPTDWRLSFRFFRYVIIILPPPSTKLPHKKNRLSRWVSPRILRTG
jgi:hypothetical protein